MWKRSASTGPSAAPPARSGGVGLLYLLAGRGEAHDALRGRDGSELWRNDKLKRRGLSRPAVTSTAIAVADYQGYVHWLDRSSGELVARQRITKDRVTNPPVAADDTVVVLTDGGKMAAFRAKPKT